jgi:acetyl esterase/lipase
MNARDLGVDSNRLAIGGDSAGGGLAAGLALLTRDRGEVPLVLQLLIYPMLDDRTVTVADPHPYTGEYIWTADANRFGWTALLGQEPGGPDISPYAAAARAEKLEGLPPTYISVGTLDLFLEEDMEYARRLIRAGVPTELHVYPGAFHGFPMAADAQVTRAHTRDYLNALTRAFDKSEPTQRQRVE